MAYTQLQYDALQAAIATGATSVKYADKSIEYRSLAEMKKILAEMAVELGITTLAVNRKYACFEKGIYRTCTG